MKKNNIKYFLAANSCEGFYSEKIVLTQKAVYVKMFKSRSDGCGQKCPRKVRAPQGRIAANGRRG